MSYLADKDYRDAWERYHKRASPVRIIITASILFIALIGILFLIYLGYRAMQG